MTTGVRLTLCGLAVAGLAVALGVGVVPVHLSLGAGSIRCGTVLRPDRLSEVASSCGPAGAHHLRATLRMGAVLALLALAPALIGRSSRGSTTTAYVAWAALFAPAVIGGVVSLALVEYSAPLHQIFDL